MENVSHNIGRRIHECIVPMFGRIKKLPNKIAMAMVSCVEVTMRLLFFAVRPSDCPRASPSDRPSVRPSDHPAYEIARPDVSVFARATEYLQNRICLHLISVVASKKRIPCGMRIYTFSSTKQKSYWNIILSILNLIPQGMRFLKRHQKIYANIYDFLDIL